MARNGKPQNSGNMKEAKQKKGGAGKKIAGVGGLAAIVAAILLYFNGGLGFGGGDSSGLKNDDKASTTSESTPTPESKDEESKEEDPAADGKVEITVGEKGISVEGREIADAAALKDFLTGINKDGVKYVLKDDNSIKADYDAVKAVLDGLSFEYSES